MSDEAVKNVKIKFGKGGFTLAHPAGKVGWINKDAKGRIANFVIENVPADLSPAEVIAKMSVTITTATLDDSAEPEDFVLDWEQLGMGRIVHHSQRWSLTDKIQETCITQMESLGLNPNKVAELVGDKISRVHVYDYLSRRKSMGSHKLQHLLPAMKLNLKPM